MRKRDIEVGKSYVAKVSDQWVTIEITGTCPTGGFYAINTKTDKTVLFRTATRIKKPIEDSTPCPVDTQGEQA